MAPWGLEYQLDLYKAREDNMPNAQSNIPQHLLILVHRSVKPSCDNSIRGALLQGTDFYVCPGHRCNCSFHHKCCGKTDLWWELQGRILLEQNTAEQLSKQPDFSKKFSTSVLSRAYIYFSLGFSTKRDLNET